MGCGPPPAAGEVTVASFNLHRLFDTVNDPTTSDPVLTQPAFDRRIQKISLAVRDFLAVPDIIAVQEVENLSTLQALAGQINADVIAGGSPSPEYAAFLTEGNDVGGIDVGFLVRSAPVTRYLIPVSVSASHTPRCPSAYIPPSQRRTAPMKSAMGPTIRM